MKYLLAVAILVVSPCFSQNATVAIIPEPLITYRDVKPIGRMMAIRVSQLKKRAGIK